jgi:KAP family P-loop domain
MPIDRVVSEWNSSEVSEASAQSGDVPHVAPTGQVRSVAIDSDAPVEDAAQDRFDRAPFAFRIADTLISRTDSASLVLAIYGVWGDGKTSVLHFIRQRLKDASSVVCVDFNPWRMTGEDDLLKGFFSTLAEALDRKLSSNMEKIGGLLKKYSFALKPIQIPGLDKFDEMLKGAGEVMSDVTLDDLRKRISNILRASNTHVVVMIDDIDRLENSEIQALFRLVKLTGDFDNVAYVLAFDDTMVAAALGERFSSIEGKSEVAGRNFLEKIVQVGLHLPPTGKEELLAYAFKQVMDAVEMSGIQIPDEAAMEFGMSFRSGIAPLLQTPRMAKRYGNALQFSLGLLSGEVRYIDLMLLEAIRTFVPKLYLAIREEKQRLLIGEKNFDASKFVRSYIPETHAESTVEGMTRIIHGLFPKTSKTSYFPDWEKKWSNEKRVCAANYFDRYFTYAVRSNDVSDTDLDGLLNGDGTFEAFMQALLKFYSVKNARAFISKLRDREEELTPEAAKHMSLGLAAISEGLPTSASILEALNLPLIQAAAFVSRALLRLPEHERLAFAKEVISSAGSALFVSACMMMMAPGSDSSEKSDDDENELFTPEQENDLRDVGAKTIVEWMEKNNEKPLFAVPVENVTNLMHAVQTGLGTDAAREKATAWVKAHPESALIVIRANKAKGTDMQTGLPIETPFMRQMYDAMVLLVAADDLIHALSTVYGDELTTVDKPTEDGGLHLARQFMAFHEIVKRQQAVQSKTASAPSSSSAAAIAVSGGAEDDVSGGQDITRNEVVDDYELEM